MSYATLSPYPVWQITDAIGGAIPGALLYVYQANTDIPVTTYTDASMSTAASNPIVSDGDGRLSVFLDPGAGAVKMILTDGVGLPDLISGRTGTEIWSRDYIFPIGGGANSGTIYVVENIAALRDLPEPTEFAQCQVLGYYEQGDGGGGEFYWDQSSADADDNGVIIQPTVSTGGRWIRQTGSEINVRFYGAYGTGIINDTPAFVSANAYCVTNGYSLLADAGTYLLSSNPSLTIELKLLPGAKLKPSADGYAFKIIIDKDDDTQHFFTTYSLSFQTGFLVKPQWFGAVADGATDDTAALRAAAVCTPVGGTLYLKGTSTSYLVGDAADYVVTLKSYLKVRGDGDSSCVKQKDSTNSAFALFGHDVSTQLSDVSIEDISIDGNMANNTAGVGILLNSILGGVSNCVIFNCYTRAMKVCGNDLRINNNKLFDNELLVSGADHITVSDNDVVASDTTLHSRYGISITPEAGRNILNTIVTGNNLTGCPITARAESEGPDILSLFIHANTVDLSVLAGFTAPSCVTVLELSGKCQVTGNILKTSNTNTSGGVYFGNINYTETLYTSISDNTIYLLGATSDNMHNGITLSNASYITVKGNNIICESTTSSNWAIKEKNTCTNITYGINNSIGFTTNTSPSVSIKVGERLALTDSGTVSATANLVLGKGNISKVNTAVSTVNLIDSLGWLAGSIAILEFTGSITLKNNFTSVGQYKSITFKNGADFITSALTTLIIKYDGTSWYEILNIGGYTAGGGGPEETLASSSNLDITLTTDCFYLTGEIDVNYIRTTGRSAGSLIFLSFASANITLNNNFGTAPSGYAKINTSGPFTGIAENTVALVFNGVDWRLLYRFS